MRYMEDMTPKLTIWPQTSLIDVSSSVINVGDYFIIIFITVDSGYCNGR